jgi:hypothetical protein
MKAAMVLSELYRSERKLARALDAVAARHHADHGICYVAMDLAGWSRNHLHEIDAAAHANDIRLTKRPHCNPAGAQLQSRISDLLRRRPEPGLLLIIDLRRVHRLAAGVSLDWELLAQASQAQKNERLLDLTQRCHPESLRQMRWANAMLKELSPQILTTL